MYDLNGNSIMGYDIGGNQFTDASEETNVDKPHKTIDYTASTSYGTYIDDSYEAFKTSLEENPTAIPFFLQSDQHGTSFYPTRYVNCLDAEDDLDIIKLNLGDYCGDSYSEDYMDSLQRQTKGVNGILCVPGNHDYKGFDYTSTTDHELLKASFTQDASWYGCKWLDSDFKCYTALDVDRSLKMIFVDPYDENGVVSNMPHPYYNTTTVDWLIDELTDDGGYDLVYCQHEPIFEQYYTRDSEEATTYNNATSLGIRPLLVAYKNKESGTFTDDDGVEHTYDFTSCEGDLILSLHGHEHAEYYDTTDFTSYTCPNGYTGVFGLIDRDAGYLRIWRFHYSAIYDELDIPLV